MIRAGSRSLRGAINSVEFFINNLKFNLSYPILGSRKDNRLCMSRMDLTKVVEPVMRPGKIKGRRSRHGGARCRASGVWDGAWSAFGWEKQFSLDVVFRAQKAIRGERLQGCMLMTH